MACRTSTSSDTTSPVDDARETLTIASLRKAKERNIELHLRLHAPHSRLGFCATRARHSPRRWTSTLWCNEKYGTRGKVGHLKKDCKQRGKGDGKRKAQKSNGVGKNQNTDTFHCCGKPGHQRPDCRHHNENCSTSGKKDHTSQVCRSGQSRSANVRARWKWIPKTLKKIRSRSP